MFPLVFLTVLFALAHGQFDEDLARNKIWPMAASAYSDNPGLCVKDNFDNATYMRQIIVECDKEVTDTCAGFTAVSYTDKAIIISFRGTEILSFELINEFATALFEKKTVFAGGHGEVSTYFYEAFLDIWNDGLRDDFFSWKNANPDFEIWITGHSLGAAIASLCAGYMTAMQYTTADKIKLVTFGQPRVGTGVFAAYMDQAIPYKYRIVHKADMVPHLPPLQLEFLGDLNNYTHHMSEIWYNNNMTVGEPHIECDKDEDVKNCSDQLEGIFNDILVLNWADHLFYYDDVAIYSYDGCAKNKTFNPKFDGARHKKLNKKKV